MKDLCLYLATHPCSHVNELPGVRDCVVAAPLEVLIGGSADGGNPHKMVPADVVHPWRWPNAWCTKTNDEETCLGVVAEVVG